MPFNPQTVEVVGFPVADVDGRVPERLRGSVAPGYATISVERSSGRGDQETMRPGDNWNMMFWRLDAGRGVNTRGRSSGGYSFAVPVREVGPALSISNAGATVAIAAPGKYLPLAAHDVVATTFEEETIREATDKDFICLATVGHGTREKIVFKGASGWGESLKIVSDYRGPTSPQRSTMVHDIGPDNKPSPTRKAGFDTAWEVLAWRAPDLSGGQTIVVNPQADGFSLAWQAGQDPRGSGYARVSWRGSSSLYAHTMGGALKPTHVQKHLLSALGNHDITAGGLDTMSKFVGSQHPFSAPLRFEEKPYPVVIEGETPYEVHLYYDASMEHPFPVPIFFAGKAIYTRPGMWRWFVKLDQVKTPKCTPTQDDPILLNYTDGNGNPHRTFAEDQRIIFPKKLVSTGIYFAQRVNMSRGPIPQGTYSPPEASDTQNTQGGEVRNDGVL